MCERRTMAELCSNCDGYFASPAKLVAHVRAAHPVGHSVEGLAWNPGSYRVLDRRVTRPRRRPEANLLLLPAVGAWIRRAP